MDGDVRTEFGPRPGRLRSAFVLTGLGVLLLAGAFAINAWTSGIRSVAPTILLGVVGLLLTGVGVSMFWFGVPRYALSFDRQGVHVRTRGRTVELPWADIDSWWAGVPSDKPVQKIRREMVLASPAAHVAQPDAGLRRLLWSRQRRRWVVCEPVLTDGTTEQIVAAMNALAPGKRSLHQ
ncbi:hypothetical protein [Tenggerimyces flavus]|uniref:PH domain-containing protein n=1 Tax=Tenggerimyces flavus TaxID=1708749 RepID=A0ABV7YIV7_9ACTN|nr:hypothetical protein [Tenggerimyces flavus]MBM7789696.1 hypothetical protein [Tenggerimyces flavus]